jgi:acyl-CoA thioester hydrolase
MSGTKSPELADRRVFPAWQQERIRFGDTDALGHVNNAVFVTLSETGRVHFLRDPAMPAAEPQALWVIARIVLDFRAELHWPEVVEIGTGVLRVGRSSVTLGQGMFRGTDCVATAENVLVLIDAETRRPVTLPEPLRTALLQRKVAALPD